MTSECEPCQVWQHVCMSHDPRVCAHMATFYRAIGQGVMLARARTYTCGHLQCACNPHLTQVDLLRHTRSVLHFSNTLTNPHHSSNKTTHTHRAGCDANMQHFGEARTPGCQTTDCRVWSMLPLTTCPVKKISFHSICATSSGQCHSFFCEFLTGLI